MMREEADAALIARAQGDRAAFAEIYDLYIHRLYAFCRSLSTSREEAEDLTAQTFEQALKAMPRYEDRGVPLSAWLFRIAAHAATDRARRHGGAVVLDGGPMLEERAPQSSLPSPELWAEQWERAVWLQSHIAALPPDQQRALALRYYEDRAVLDVATRMGRSEGSVKQLLHRAIAALRLRLGEEVANA